MGKTKGLPFEDIHKRCSFLYQAAHESLVRNPSDVSLCRFYMNTMTVIARRQSIHLHPDMKRKICKRCCLLLKPGISAIYRVKKKRQQMTTVTCLGCGTLRRYVYKRGDVQHIDQPDVWVDSIVNGEQVGKQQQQQQQQHKGDRKKKHSVEAMDTNVEYNKPRSADVPDSVSEKNKKIGCEDSKTNVDGKVT